MWSALGDGSVGKGFVVAGRSKNKGENGIDVKTGKDSGGGGCQGRGKNFFALDDGVEGRDTVALHFVPLVSFGFSCCHSQFIVENLRPECVYLVRGCTNSIAESEFRFIFLVLRFWSHPDFSIDRNILKPKCCIFWGIVSKLVIENTDLCSIIINIL